MSAKAYRVKIDAEIEQVDGAAWDALCGERPFTTVYWLKFLEQVLVDYQPHYLQLWQGERLVAGAVCQPQRHFHLSAYLKNKALHKIASQLLAWLPPNACLLPLFLRDGLLLHPGVETAVWLPRLLAEIKKLSRQRWASFTYLGNLTPALAECSAGQGFRIISILQDTYLDIAWDHFDDYLTHLTTRRRKRVKAYIRNAEDAGVEIQEMGRASSGMPQIEMLIRGVADKHDNAFLYQPDFLHRAQAYLQPESFHTLLAWDQDEPIATVTLFRSGDELVAKWIGMNYGRTYQTYAYHYLTINIVKKAIDLGIRRVDFGPTSYTLKRQLGCRFEDRAAGLKVGI